MKICGVYVFINKVNRKAYTGASIDVYQRFSGHKSTMRNGYHSSKEVQKDYDIYGESVFWFGLLIKCDKSELLKYEKWLHDHFNPAYTSRRLDMNTNAGLKLCAETRRRMTIANKDKNKGEDHGRAKIKNHQIAEIFKLSKDGLKQKDIAEKYSVDQSTINSILKRKTFKSVAI